MKLGTNVTVAISLPAEQVWGGNMTFEGGVTVRVLNLSQKSG